MSHLPLPLLFAKLEVEGVDTDGEVDEDRPDDHRAGDGQGPGKSGGDGEVVTKDSSLDFANPDANPDQGRGLAGKCFYSIRQLSPGLG